VGVVNPYDLGEGRQGVRWCACCKQAPLDCCCCYYCWLLLLLLVLAAAGTTGCCCGWLVLVVGLLVLPLLRAPPAGAAADNPGSMGPCHSRRHLLECCRCRR
jgi:hypothetical protein